MALFSHVGSLASALDYHLERHSLLASNIAHVDTPRYKPNDLARLSDAPFHQVLHTTLNRTHPGHLSTGDSKPSVGHVFQDLSAGGGADGNFVSLDREAGKMAANKLRYDVVSVLVKSSLQSLLSAAGDGKRG